MADNIEMSGGSSPQQSSTSTATVTPPRMNPALAAAIIPSSSSLQSRSTTSTASITGKCTSAFFFIALLSGIWLWICNNRIAVFGASVTFAGCLIGLAALVPAFAGQQLTEEALELARWTALKDFVEQCWERKADGHVSPDCEKAMGASLPPPPHMDVEKQMSRLVARIPSFQEVNLRITHGYASIWSSVGIWHLAALLAVYGVLLILWFQVIDRLRRSELRSSSGNDAVQSSGRALALDEEMGEERLAVSPRNPASAHQNNSTELYTCLFQEDSEHLTWLDCSLPSSLPVLWEHGDLSPRSPPASLPAAPPKHPYSGAYYSSGSFAAAEALPVELGASGQDALFDFDLLPSVSPGSGRGKGKDASTQTDPVLPRPEKPDILIRHSMTLKRREHGEQQHTLETGMDRRRGNNGDDSSSNNKNNGNELDQVSRHMRSRPLRPERQTESRAARQRLRDRFAQPADLHLARSGIVQRRQSRASYVEGPESTYSLPDTSAPSSSETHDDMAMSSAVEYQNNLIMNRDVSRDMNMDMDADMNRDMNLFLN